MEGDIIMGYGVFYDWYEKELNVYRLFQDGSRRKILRLYEKNNFVHLDIRANNFQYFMGFNVACELMDSNMAGVNINALYMDMIIRGFMDIDE